MSRSYARITLDVWYDDDVCDSPAEWTWDLPDGHVEVDVVSCSNPIPYGQEG